MYQVWRAFGSWDAKVSSLILGQLAHFFAPYFKWFASYDISVRQGDAVTDIRATLFCHACFLVEFPGRGLRLLLDSAYISAQRVRSHQHIKHRLLHLRRMLTCPSPIHTIFMLLEWTCTLYISVRVGEVKRTELQGYPIVQPYQTQGSAYHTSDNAHTVGSLDMRRYQHVFQRQAVWLRNPRPS